MVPDVKSSDPVGAAELDVVVDSGVKASATKGEVSFFASGVETPDELSTFVKCVDSGADSDVTSSVVVVLIIGDEASVEASEDFVSCSDVDVSDILSVLKLIASVVESESTVSSAPVISSVDISSEGCEVNFIIFDVEVSAVIFIDVTSSASVVDFELSERLSLVIADVESSLVAREVDFWVSGVVNSVIISDEVISSTSFDVTEVNGKLVLVMVNVDVSFVGCEVAPSICTVVPSDDAFDIVDSELISTVGGAEVSVFVSEVCSAISGVVAFVTILEDFIWSASVVASKVSFCFSVVVSRVETLVDLY